MMTVLILKLITDVFWYLAAMMPVISSVPAAAGVVFLAVPCVYAAWMMIFGRNRDFSGNCQDTFLFEGKVLAAVGFFELVILGLNSWQKQCGPFVLGFLLAGILLLRICRVTGAQSQVRFLELNGLSMLPVLAAAVVLASKTVRGAAAALIGGVYQKLILPVLLGILKLFLTVLQALAPLFSFVFPGLTEISSDMETVVLDTDSKVDFGELYPIEIPIYLKVIGILILGAMLAVLFYALYKRITGAGGDGGRPPVSEIKRSRLSPEERREQGAGLFGREKNVRYYYRKFLHLCREKGMEVGISSTSEEIERRAAGYWPEQELSELGRLYRQVRYGNRKDGSKERQAAREIYRKLKDT